MDPEWVAKSGQIRTVYEVHSSRIVDGNTQYMVQVKNVRGFMEWKWVDYVELRHCEKLIGKSIAAKETLFESSFKKLTSREICKFTEIPPIIINEGDIVFDIDVINWPKSEKYKNERGKQSQIQELEFEIVGPIEMNGSIRWKTKNSSGKEIFYEFAELRRIAPTQLLFWLRDNPNLLNDYV